MTSDRTKPTLRRAFSTFAVCALVAVSSIPTLACGAVDVEGTPYRTNETKTTERKTESSKDPPPPQDDEDDEPGETTSPPPDAGAPPPSTPPTPSSTCADGTGKECLLCCLLQIQTDLPFEECLTTCSFEK